MQRAPIVDRSACDRRRCARTDSRMRTVLIAVLATMILSGSALSATIVNKDAGSIVLVVTENGSRMEVAIDAGASETVCPAGCFVTLPNGDRVALEGGETVEISQGGAAIK